MGGPGLQAPCAALGLLLLVCLPACAGLFQRGLPQATPIWERRDTGPLRVGFAEADITPQSTQYLAGFGLAREATGVHSPLRVRAMVVLAGARPIAIVGIDNLGLLREDADWIKQRLAGFANGDVFLCSSHTHAAPDLVGIWGLYFLTSGRDPGYLRQVGAAVADAVAAAHGAARPASLHRGEARLPPRGLVKNANVRGLFNRRVTVLEARDRRTGAPFGALLHLACHPEMMRRNDTLVSADMTGELCEQWRAAGHGQAVFVNGELGAMISPDHHPRGAEGMAAAGSKLLALCEQARESAVPVGAGATGADAVVVRRRDVYLTLNSPGLCFGRLTGAIRADLYGGCLRASVGYLEIGSFAAIAVPGEMEPALAARIRARLCRPDLVVFGLVDTEAGYLMREVDARNPLFGYERTMSPGPRAGERVAAALTGAR